MNTQSDAITITINGIFIIFVFFFISAQATVDSAFFDYLNII